MSKSRANLSHGSVVSILFHKPSEMQLQCNSHSLVQSGSIHSQWTFFHSTGIIPVKVMEWPGTVRPVALTVLFTKLPASQFTAILLVCLVQFLKYQRKPPYRMPSSFVNKAVKSLIHKATSRVILGFAWYNFYGTGKMSIGCE